MTDNPRYRLDAKTIEMLVCPLTKTRLRLSAGRNELISEVARLAFPIRKGVPLLVVDAARALGEDEIEAMRRAPDR